MSKWIEFEEDRGFPHTTTPRCSFCQEALTKHGDGWSGHADDCNGVLAGLVKDEATERARNFDKQEYFKLHVWYAELVRDGKLSVMRALILFPHYDHLTAQKFLKTSAST